MQIVLNFYSIYMEMWIHMWIKQLYNGNSGIYFLSLYE